MKRGIVLPYRRRKGRPRPAWGRISGRFVQVTGVVLLVLLLVVQYARILERNFVVAHDVAMEEKAIALLRGERDREHFQILRLEQPSGAVPEIHDRLHLVGPHEVIVYLRHPNDGSNAAP